MTTTTLLLWSGVGGDVSPDVFHLDQLIGRRLQARGYRGTRDPKLCTYVSTSRNQALDYALDGREDHLRLARPSEGAILSWCPDHPDLLMSFDDYLRRMDRHSPESFWDWSMQAFLDDIRGSIDTVETYLRLKRQKRNVTRLVDAFLEEVHILETMVSSTTDLAQALSTHKGEIWITGPCSLEPILPLATQETPDTPLQTVTG